MRYNMLKSKIHKATVTDSNMEYEGSITIGIELMESANLLPFEKVAVSNANNGERFETYVIPGGKGEICINGPAARKALKGDVVVIFCFASYDEAEAKNHTPLVVRVDSRNNVLPAQPDSIVV